MRTRSRAASCERSVHRIEGAGRLIAGVASTSRRRRSARPGAELPPFSPFEPGDRRTQVDDALGQAARDGLGQRAHAVRRRGEEGVACARAGAVTAPGLRPETEDEASMAPLDVAEARHRRGQRQPLGVCRVDPRGGLPARSSASRPAAGARIRPLSSLGSCAGKHEVERHAQCRPREERRARHGRASVGARRRSLGQRIHASRARRRGGARLARARPE